MKALKLLFMLASFVSVLNSQVPLPPVLTLPPNNSVNISITPQLRWNFSLALGEILSYRLQLSDSANFSSVIYDKNDISNNYHTLPQGTLSYDTRYFWRVSATVKIGIITLTTAYSSPFNFTTTGVTGILQTSQTAPGEYKLYNNYPNPFNPSTNIKFDVRFSGDVKLEIFNVSGESVQAEQLGSLSAGSYEYKWDASGMPSGIYFYRLTALNDFSPASDMQAFIRTKKMILVK